MRFKILATLLILITLLLSVILGLLVFRPALLNQQAQLLEQKRGGIIAGKFDINGVAPNGATITLTQKEYGTTNSPEVFAQNLVVADHSSWSFEATAGKTYEIQAKVFVNGEEVTHSNPLVATAPADEEILTLNIPAQEGARESSATISGGIVVNGYIPTGSTITIQGRKLGAQNFTNVARNLPGMARQQMTYTTAISGTTYEIQGLLLNANGDTIGTSNLLTITAPAANETLVINSSALIPTSTPLPTSAPQQVTATPTPQVSSAISGNMNFNGAAPANSRIVVLQSTPGSNNYSVAVDNITPIDGTSWTWSGASPSTWYTLMAVLKQRNSNGTDTDIAYSSPVTIASPATGVVLSINSGVSLGAPGGPITVNCQTYNSGPNQNNWNVVVTFGTVPGAQSYWYQIGPNSGSNSTVNTATTSNTVNATFNNNTTYYAQYAYANVPSAPLGSSEWSGFSSPTPLQCSH